MKFEFIVIFILVHSFTLKGQTCDNIIFNDGTETKVKLEEIKLDVISYRNCENFDGPLYIIEKEKVFMIKYANGDSSFVSKENIPDDSKRKKKLYFSKVPESELKELSKRNECITYVLKDGSVKDSKIIAFQKSQVVMRSCKDGLGFGINNIDLKKIEGEEFILYFDVFK